MEPRTSLRVGITDYLTLDSMSERNNPEPGDYLVRVHVKRRLPELGARPYELHQEVMT